MKRLFVLCSLFLSTYLMADRHHWLFKGRGEWVSKTGETGRYGVVAKGHYNNQGLKMTNSYKHGGKSWTMTIFLKKRAWFL